MEKIEVTRKEKMDVHTSSKNYFKVIFNRSAKLGPSDSLYKVESYEIDVVLFVFLHRSIFLHTNIC